MMMMSISHSSLLCCLQALDYILVVDHGGEGEGKRMNECVDIVVGSCCCVDGDDGGWRKEPVVRVASFIHEFFHSRLRKDVVLFWFVTRPRHPSPD